MKPLKNDLFKICPNLEKHYLKEPIAYNVTNSILGAQNEFDLIALIDQLVGQNIRLLNLLKRGGIKDEKTSNN
jgi:hypothetical protein